jgi:RNA polymerase sigma factor (sigma-70 family)
LILNNYQSNSKKLTDETLWNQLKAGDEEAFSLLFEKYYGSLVNYGKTLTLTPNIIKDCVQDVFVDLWTYRHSLNDTVIVKAYLLSCVRKRIVRLYERDRIFRNISEIDEMEFLLDFSMEEHMIDSESQINKVKKLNKLINSLPERQKEALYLRYYQSLTVYEVADVFEMNYQSTKNLIHRALSNLRKEWKGSLSFLFALYLSLL